MFILVFHILTIHVLNTFTNTKKITICNILRCNTSSAHLQD